MTLHVLHGGNGYRYLTRTVATADVRQSGEQNLADFARLSGTPPGLWCGRGAEHLGVAGQVTTAQMRALFGQGLHPNAQEILATGAAAGIPPKELSASIRLGSPFYRLGGATTPISEIHARLIANFTAMNGRAPSRRDWAALRRAAALEHLSRDGEQPTPREMQKALADERRRMRKPVAGYEGAFAGPASVSKVLFGLGSPAVRQVLWQAHLDAIRETVHFAEQHYAITRRGRGGVRKIDADGFAAVLFTHWDNRVGDPFLHTHMVIPNKVLGVDGRWSCLDARALHQAAVSLSCRYNATLIGMLQRRLGLQFEERSRGRGKKPTLEIVGIPDELIQLFSQRRAEIQTATEQLVLEFERCNGHSPDKVTQIKLAKKATLATRGSKPLPRPLEEMFDEWDARATELLASGGDSRSGRQFVEDVTRASSPVVQYRPRIVAIHAGVAAGPAAIQAGDLPVLSAAVDTELRRFRFDSPAARAAAQREALALLSLSHPDNVVAEVQKATRRVFVADRIASEVVQRVSAQRTTWTETHVRAETEDRLALCEFPDDAAHRAAVEQVVALVLDAHSIRLTIDPEPVPAAMQRRNGDSVFAGPSATTVRYTSTAVLDREAQLQDAAQQPTPEFLTHDEVAAAIAAVEQADTHRGAPRRLTIGQRRVAAHLCTTGTRLAVAVGPAGAGKTTALRAVVRAWRDAGRAVIALSPQKSSARVLAADIGIPADTIASVLWAHRNGRGPTIPSGAMLLVDEAGMASTADLAALQRLADQAGAVVRWVGDPWQLSAVEAGGALRLIAADTKCPELDMVVRFTDLEEAAATLHVRNGDPKQAWQFYDSRSRVRSGLAVQLREQMLAAHLHDLDEGASSLMMAATVDDVYRLNGAAQAAHAQRGSIDLAGSSGALSDGHRGYVGDIVVTRRNARRIRITGGSRSGSPVTNGDRWRVLRVHDDGSLTVVGADHRGRVHLPRRYVAEDVELGYACTVHRAQGLTVDRAHLLMGTSLGRALAYVGLSRGQHLNLLYLVTDTLPEPPPLDRAPDEPVDPAEMFARVLAREDDNLSATEVMRRELDSVNDRERLTERYSEACRILGADLASELLDRSLPAVLFHQVRNAPSFALLADTLTVAGQTGMDIVALVSDIVTNSGADDRGETLLTARDAAALLCERADRLIAEHLAAARANTTDHPHIHIATTGDRIRAAHDVTFTTPAPLPPRHPGMDTELADCALRLRIRLLDAQQATPAAELRDVGARVLVEDEQEVDDAVVATDTDARMRADYEHYTRQLALDHANYLLDRAFPVALLRHVQSGRTWPQLLDTIAVADWHHLDPVALVTHITTGDWVSLLHARDAAGVLRARADAWIAEHLGAAVRSAGGAQRIHAAVGGRATTLLDNPSTSRFQTLRDLPRPHALRPIPPLHPGMDTTTADYADQLRRQLLGVPATEPDWRARPQHPTRLATLLSSGDNDGSDVADVPGPLPPAVSTDLWQVERGAHSGHSDAASGDSDDWISVTDARTDHLYPELDPLARVIRIESDIAALRTRVTQLREAIAEGRSKHQLAIAPLVQQCRERVDMLRPLLLSFRDAQLRAEEAELDAAAAEGAYQQALQQQPEQVDDQFLGFLHSQAVAAAEDPGMRARLEEMLDQYRAAMIERAAAEVDADIAQARLLADDARAWADRLRGEADTAQRELDAAAGTYGVVEESDVHQMRLLGDELAIDELNAARAELRRLPPYLHRARVAAAATSRPAGGAAQEVIDEQSLLDQLRSDPLRLHSDSELDALAQSLKQATDRADAEHIETAQTHAVEVRGLHARLIKQVAAIRAAERALSAAERESSDDRARAAADAAVAAAAAIGAPRHRWAALLMRAADTDALARELAAAEQADRRDQQLREEAEARAARSSSELAAVVQEQRRRAGLDPAVAAMEHRLRDEIGEAPETTPASAVPIHDLDFTGSDAGMEL
ncbi:MobF family relaxase [Nocardia asiatica]|uniref:MobF family relaxase n=1 Tax=Nocardia asiatica TaxID=209252 RepID=UPI0005C23CCA|nr:MobF family relaxase [Nocardia asiatica]